MLNQLHQGMGVWQRQRINLCLTAYSLLLCVCGQHYTRITRTSRGSAWQQLDDGQPPQAQQAAW